MKTKLTLAVVFTLILQLQLYAQNVNINDAGSPSNSTAMLDVSSASKGILVPRLVQAQHFAIGFTGDRTEALPNRYFFL